MAAAAECGKLAVRAVARGRARKALQLRAPPTEKQPMPSQHTLDVTMSMSIAIQYRGPYLHGTKQQQTQKAGDT